MSILRTNQITDTAGNSAMMINNTGVVTFTNSIIQPTPTRPSFYVANLNGTTWNGGTLTGADTSGYGYSNGSMSYNSSTGEKTVPLTGLYMISFGILQNPNSGRGEAGVQRQPSGGSYGFIFTIDGNGTSTYNSIGIGFTFTLTASDKLKVTRNSGTAYAYAHPSHFINVAYIGG